MEDVTEALMKTIAKGAGIFLIGSLFSLVTGLGYNVLVIRYLTKYEYGVFAFALAIVGIISSVVTFGIPLACVRQASYYMGKGENDKANAILKLSLYLLTLLGILGSLITLTTSDYLSSIFKIGDLSWVLKVLSVCIPFSILTTYFVSVYQIFGRAEVKTIFQNVVSGSLQLLLIALVVLLKMPFKFVVAIYDVVSIITFLLIIIYFKRSKLNLRTSENPFKFLKSLLVFAVPFAVQTLLSIIINWADTLVIGYYLTPVEVALYRCAATLATQQTLILAAFGFLYYPILSKLQGRNMLEESRRIYAMITRWVAIATLPIFAAFLLYPDKIIEVLYGYRYVDASGVLKLLAIGFFVHSIFGPNGLTLASFGEVSFLTAVSGVMAASNLILSLLLTPVLGITGAAISSSFTYILGNALANVRLYLKYKIHPFTKNYLKPLIFYISLNVVIYYLVLSKIRPTISSLLIIGTLLLLTIAFAVVATGSVESVDVAVLSAVKQRLLKR